MSVSNISASSGFIIPTDGMTSEERIANARHNFAVADAIKAASEQERGYGSALEKYQELKAARSDIDIKEVLATAKAKAEEHMKTIKTVFEMHTPQGTIKVDSGGGFSTDSAVLAGMVHSTLQAKRDSGELSKPANASEGVAQLVDLITSMFGKTGETTKGIESVLELSSSRGTASLLSDGSIKSSGDVSSVIEQLLLPGNALSAKPGTSLEQIISDRTNVLQALFGILA